MKSLILRKKMCIWLAVLLLFGGVYLSMSQTVSFVAYSYAKSEVSVSISDISDGWFKSQASVLSSLTNYHAEQMSGKAFSGRMRYYNGLGEHGIFYTIWSSLFHIGNMSHKEITESDVVYHLCSTLIIDYVHLMDGAKG